MSLRGRLALIAAAAVATVGVLASATMFMVLRHELRARIDHGLALRADELSRRPLRALRLAVSKPDQLGQQFFFQIVPAEGQPVGPPAGVPSLPVTPETRAVAAGTLPGFYTSVRAARAHYRVLTRQLAPGYALRIGRPLTETDKTLHVLTVAFLIVAGAGAASAGLLGLAVAGAALQPLRRLTNTIHEVRATGELDRRVTVTGNDELAELGRDFNAMLASLEASLGAQQQLVADASHELRTPLTSLRANVELLTRRDRITAEQQKRLRAAVTTQIDEMTKLISSLIELARGQDTTSNRQQLQLDQIVERAVALTEANRPDISIHADLEPTPFNGDPDSLERAITNVLDNAAKFSPPDGRIDVTLHDHELAITDHGPGIPSEDLPHIFDRFYRAANARALPGSGLGLAIVRQTIENHGGTVSAEPATQGGTTVRIRF
jgi:two-component system sensor histidine kinase MprB